MIAIADMQPGHGAPSLLSTLFMEGAITRFYPQYPMSAEGTESFIRAFSMPGGFPSHVCPPLSSDISSIPGLRQDRLADMPRKLTSR